MLSSSVFCNELAAVRFVPTTTTTTTTTTSGLSRKSKTAKSNSAKFSSIRLGFRATLKPVPQCQSSTSLDAIDEDEKSRVRFRVLESSLRVLEWDKVCDAISSFAGTSLGREASKQQLRSVDQTYEDSLKLLSETNAAVEIHKYNNAIMDFTGIDTVLVRSAIDNAQRASTVNGRQAMAVAALLQFSEVLQSNVRAAIKENADMHKRFMPLAEMILDCFTSKSLVRSILQVINEDGSIKDSASPRLKQARWRVMDLESKIVLLSSSEPCASSAASSALIDESMSSLWILYHNAFVLSQ